MQIIQGGRGSGKTYSLVCLSHLSGYPILVRTKNDKENVKLMAEQLGFTIPEPIVFRSKQDYRAIRTTKVLVDNVDMWLSAILSEHFGSEIAAITMNIDDNKNVVNLMHKENT